jgi:multidrug efflux pump subunit AcrA (membrane-fusion protein)
MLNACKKAEQIQQEKVIPVKVMSVSPQMLTGGRNYVGTVEESTAISLGFSSLGTVEQVFVSEGQRVQKGQLLATLNTASAQNSLDAVQATLSQAQDAYDRMVKLHDNGSLPDIKFVEVESGLRTRSRNLCPEWCARCGCKPMGKLTYKRQSLWRRAGQTGSARR